MSDFDLLNEIAEDYIAEEEEERNISEHGIKYNGSQIKHQPWAYDAGIYCIKPEVYYNCPAYSDQVKIGFAGGDSQRGTLSGRMASYATSFVEFRIIFVITYDSHDKASQAEGEMKRFLAHHKKSARPHMSGQPSEWFEMDDSLIPKLIEYMYDVGKVGYSVANKDIFDENFGVGTVVWFEYAEDSIKYPAKIKKFKTGDEELEEFRERIENKEMYVVEFFDEGKYKSYDVVEEQFVYSWDEGLALDFDKDAYAVGLGGDVKRALAYIKRNTKPKTGEVKPEPSMGFWFNRPANMTSSGDISEFALDPDHPFVSRNDRQRRRLEHDLRRAEDTEDQDEIEVAKYNLNKMLRERANTSVEKFYGPRMDAPSPEPQARTEFDDDFIFEEQSVPQARPSIFKFAQQTLRNVLSRFRLRF